MFSIFNDVIRTATRNDGAEPNRFRPEQRRGPISDSRTAEMEQKRAKAEFDRAGQP